MRPERRQQPLHTTVAPCRVLGQSSQSAQQHRYVLSRTAHSPLPVSQVNNPSEQELRSYILNGSGYRNKETELKNEITGHSVRGGADKSLARS